MISSIFRNIALRYWRFLLIDGLTDRQINRWIDQRINEPIKRRTLSLAVFEMVLNAREYSTRQFGLMLGAA